MLTFFDSSLFLFQTSLTPGNWNIFEQRLSESGFIGITLLCCSVGRISLATRSGTFYLLFCFTFLLFTFVYFAQNCTGTISEDTERQKVIVLLCTLYCSWTMLFFCPVDIFVLLRVVRDTQIISIISGAWSDCILFLISEEKEKASLFLRLLFFQMKVQL